MFLDVFYSIQQFNIHWNYDKFVTFIHSRKNEVISTENRSSLDKFVIITNILLPFVEDDDDGDDKRLFLTSLFFVANKKNENILDIECQNYHFSID